MRTRSIVRRIVRPTAAGPVILLLGAAVASAQDVRPAPDTTGEIGGRPTPGEAVIDSGVGGEVEDDVGGDVGNAAPGAEAVDGDEPAELRGPASTTDDIAGKPTPEEPVAEVVPETDCAGYGTGYSAIPGTSTCLRIGGYVRFDSGFGDLNGVDTDDPADGDAETWAQRTRFSFNTYTSGETALGRVDTFTEVRFNYGDVISTNPIDVEDFDGEALRTSESDTTLNFAWIELGGLRLGKGESLFLTFTDYAGAVINDTTVGGYGPFDTEFVNYTFAPDEEETGPSAAVGIENGANEWLIDDYVPHVVLAAGTPLGPFVARASVGWDSRDDVDEEGGYAAKLRGDYRFSELSSVFLMGLYGENSSGYTTWRDGNVDDDTVSAIAGHTATLTDRLVSNGQLQWVAGADGAGDGDDLYGLALNVAFELVPGVAVTPELQWRRDGSGDDDFGGVIRAQASF